jgi:hypothetical protein
MHYLRIPMTTETYDDDVALRAYVLKYFPHLLTPLERRVIEYSAPIVGNSDHWKIRQIYVFLEERDGHVPDHGGTPAVAWSRQQTGRPKHQ